MPPIELRSYPTGIRLCPVTNLKFYILSRTASIHKSSKLLLSYIKPYKPVSNSTIGRWVKSTLLESGIDTNTFSAHSSRTASSSYGFSSGLPLKDILKAGGWSNAETFAKHYNKPVSDPNFGHNILDKFSSSHEHSAKPEP